MFVELQTLQFGVYLAVIQFNKGFLGLKSILDIVGVSRGNKTLKGFTELDFERVYESQRHSLTNVKIVRKKIGLQKNKKFVKLRKRKVSHTNRENFRSIEAFLK